MSLSAACPTEYGPARYVIFRFDDSCSPRVCHVGIFTCDTSNLVITRSPTVTPSELEFTEGVAETKTVYQASPTITGDCSYIDTPVQTTAISEGDGFFTVSNEVTDQASGDLSNTATITSLESTPAGTYTLELLVLGNRKGMTDTTTMFVEYVTITVTGETILSDLYLENTDLSDDF